ncbi:hypothetical protein GCM10009846_22720 [Agrococcus versicolor]|uniref:Uncharacterized protein n=1 Tax=Agrococcus versicolor TaxID=501482 RepID=A0ABN3AU97_9MICO
MDLSLVAVSALGIAGSLALLASGVLGVYRIVIDRRLIPQQRIVLLVAAVLLFPIGGLVWLAASDLIVAALGSMSARVRSASLGARFPT